MIYWLYGQPGAGKTTLGDALKKRLLSINPDEKIIRIDGDEMREVFNNKNYAIDGRIENMKKVNDLTRFLYKKGYTVIISVVAPFLEMRNKILDLNPMMIYIWTDMVRGRECYATDYMVFDPDDYQIRTDDDKTVGKCIDEILKFRQDHITRRKKWF